MIFPIQGFEFAHAFVRLILLIPQQKRWSLQMHVKETNNILKKGGAVGRKLDFMMQELNRESNTLASKSINAEITASAVELKVLIEQMREQIQNLE